VRLGSVATAVYWHVKSKDELVRLAGDEVWNEIELPDLSVDWRTAATTMANNLYATFTRHPWLVQAFSSGSPLSYGPGKARYDDHNIAIYEMAGFIGAEADRATATVFMFVLGSALGELATVRLKRRLSRAGGNAEERMQDTIVRAIEIARRFPRLGARIEAGQTAEYGAAPDKSFEFGLQAIFDGLEARLAAGRTLTARGRPNTQTGSSTPADAQTSGDGS